MLAHFLKLSSTFTDFNCAAQLDLAWNNGFDVTDNIKHSYSITVNNF